MDLKDLLSGIAVVIDDRIDAVESGDEDENEGDDLIVEIVRRLERDWNLPCHTVREMPLEGMWPSLLQAASFVLLDWKLWPNGAADLEKNGIERNIQFIERAMDYLVPVFIFTNEDPADVKARLPASIYDEEKADKSFVFIQRKNALLHGDALRFDDVERWVTGNASVYSLKVWSRAFDAARKELFGSMYARSADWPKVFWKAYEEDGVDPGSSLTHLINDNLRGRMRTDSFESEVLAAPVGGDVSREDLQALIAEVSLQSKEGMPDDEIRCGDLFRRPKGKILINIRPDCDCVPRNTEIDEVDLYCIEGQKISDSQLGQRVRQGQIVERIAEGVVFGAYQGRNVRFDFKKLSIEKFGELKQHRVGRLLHPYLTRLQQRYALFLQRQGLPRIPEGAIPEPRPARAAEEPDTEKTDR